MKWLVAKGKSLLTVVVLKALIQFLVAIFPSVYWLVILDQSVGYLTTASLGFQIFVAVTAVTPMLVYLIVYLRGPQWAGAFSSRYWLWFKSPFRRVSFDFSNYLGLSGSSDRPYANVAAFNAKFRVNGWKLRPQEFFLISNITGARVDVLIDTGSSIGPQNRVTAASIEEIPTGQWFFCGVHFGEQRDSEFLQEFGSFKLVFIYSGGRRSTVNFSLPESSLYINRFLKYTRPVAPPGIKLKPSEAPTLD